MAKRAFTPGMLFDTEIACAQRVLRFLRQDTRFTEQERAVVADAATKVINVLSNVQNRPVEGQLTTKGKA